MHIVVVGAGIAGSSVTRIAAERGHMVTLLSDGRPHSLAATAVLRKAYHKTKEEAAAWDRSMELYREWGVPMVEGGIVSHYRVPGRRTDKDWRMISPVSPLRNAVNAKVEHVASDHVVLADGEKIHADRVVVCVGATSHLSWMGQNTFGVTWTHVNPAALAVQDKVRVHHIAPYKTITAGVIGGVARLGSSSASTWDKARAQAKTMLLMAGDLGIVTTDKGWKAVEGARIRSEERVIAHRGYYVMTGYHRTGYALAPADAERLVDAL